MKIKCSLYTKERNSIQSAMLVSRTTYYMCILIIKIIIRETLLYNEKQ